MNSNEQSFIDKLFNRIGKNKKTSNSTNTRNSKDQNNDINAELVDSRKYKLKSNSNSFPYASNSNSVTLYETNSSFDTSSYIEPISNTNSVNLRTNINYDLSTIKEEESNRLTMELSSSNRASGVNINIDDVTHKLNVTNYLTPTYCDFCSKLLMGLIKQGLKCQICNLNFHKHCIPNMPKICNKQLNIVLAQQTNSENFSKTPNQINQFMYDKSVKQVEIEHTFIKRQAFTSNRFASICDVCQQKIVNEKSFNECKDCQITVHTKCASKSKKNCRPTRTSDDDENDMDFSSEGDISVSKMSVDSSDDDDENKVEVPDISPVCDGGVPDTIGTFKQFKPTRKRSQIGLQRLSQRVKKSNGYFWSGHMYYYTNKNLDPITHYWKLDSKSIVIYDSYRLEKKLNEINLESIKKAKLSGLNLNNNNNNNKEDNYINDQKCLFVLVTDNEIFYCGMGNADQNSTMNVLARNFYNIFKMVSLPYGNLTIKPSMKITPPKYEEKYLNEEFAINPQDLLGSGQFGQVYGGVCKATKQGVAIKVIDKTRFKDFQAETSIFQNELTILYNVQHLGIVKLFALFDEAEKLYIVTEKLSTDMLEMILSKKPPRLNERVAKFIIYQILIALSKLHERNIAHCDLKPENILLVENVEFPQIKLCDFGYAKIIGENSFRRSMVGTPAYSPPELKQKRLYNNSIDMWSMGVIVYVSLSGTFPFEEDRDIYEQIRNANFMFPDDPWKYVSRNAIDLINQFLQVKIDRRMSVNKALQHPWFSEDFQLFLDLLDLEKRVGQKWLTTKTQEDKWNQSIHL